jgi:hypothetical protein
VLVDGSDGKDLGSLTAFVADIALLSPGGAGWWATAPPALELITDESI